MPSERPPSHSDEFFLLVDAVEDYAIFLLSPTGVIRSWNRGAARIMGYTESEAVGQHFSIFYGQSELAADKPGKELAEAISVGKVEDEGWRLRSDGTRFWANTVITALRNPDGTLHGFSKVTRDMSARRKAEEELRQSGEIFQLLVSSVREYAIFMLDPQGRVATWNSGAQRIKQYRPEEIIGRHFSVFYGEQDVLDRKPEKELEIASAVGMVEDVGWRFRKDGSRFWANVVITAVRDETGELRGFAKVTRDITDRKESEERERALVEQREARLIAEADRSRAEASYHAAQEANRAKDEFLMTLSHELRTPMTAILGWSKMLPMIAPEDPLFQEAVTSIVGSAELQGHLIDDILDVSRIVSGKLRLTPEAIEVASVIMNAVDAVAATAEAKQITITTSLPAGLGIVRADPTRIQQVLWNLLTNAVKFTPRNGAVNVSAQRNAENLQISVRDNGEGIDPQFLPHLFEPFRQAERPSTRVHGGLGLGMSIVRHIVEAHGGTVSAESEGRGLGATFTFTLPVRVATEGVGSVRPALGEKFMHGSRLRDLDIVLVDDDHESRKMISAVLRAAGARVLAFDSAQAALDEMKNHRPRLVLTDIAMPVMDGVSLARALRELPDYDETMKIVALSAFPSSSSNVEDFDAYLTKPIDPFQLVDEIARIVTKTPA